MNLDQYISELLYEHDCVIIPGFGGIVASYRHSFLNPAHHTFSPPSKKLAFNASLRNNDGLLANHIASRLSISYHDANNLITPYVESCMRTLKDGKKLFIEKIGQLYLDEEHNLQFVPDLGVNYLKTSFGLNTIHSPAVKRVEKEESGFNPIRSNKKRTRTGRIAWRIIEVIPAAAILVMLVINPTIIRKLNEQAASLNPFCSKTTSSIQPVKHQPGSNNNDNKRIVSESKPNAFALQPLAKQPIDVNRSFNIKDNSTVAEASTKPAPVIKLKEAITTPEETVEKTVVKIDKEKPAPVASSDAPAQGKLYYVIGGCFSVFENAVNFRDQMIAEGFQAAIIGQSEKGLHMVSLYSSPEKSNAYNEMALIKEKAESNAWMFRK